MDKTKEIKSWKIKASVKGCGMTIIICKRIDCAYIKERPDKRYQCNLSPIEIGQDKKCDSYMAMPKPAVEANEESCKFREIDPSSPFQTGNVRYFCKYTVQPNH